MTPKSKQAPRSSLVFVRCTPEERAKLEQIAGARGLGVVIRQWIAEAPTPAANVTQRKQTAPTMTND